MMTTAPIIAAPIPRWPGGRAARRPPVAAWGGAMLLHVAVGAVVLTGVRLAVAPPPSGDHTVALVFAPAPHAAPPPVPRPPDPTPVQSPDAPAPPVASPPRLQPVPPPDPTAPPLPAAIPPPPPAVPAAKPPPSRPPPKQLPAKPHPVAPAPTRRAMAAPAHPPPPPPSPSPAPTPALAGDPAPAHPAAPAPIAVDWQRALANWLATHKTYPEAARRDGEQGNVVLRFTVDRSGRVLNVEPADSNAPAALRAAAETMLRGATVPRFPETMPQDRITITVRIHYALTD